MEDNKQRCGGTFVFFLGLFLTTLVGCYAEYRDDLDYSHRVLQTWELNELEGEVIVQFEEVFWEPDDTISLREQITEGLIVEGRSVLEIGTGTGLLAVLSLRCDAKSVVATDVNPAAVANARYNAAMLAPQGEIDVRAVPSDSLNAFSVIGEDEKFDLIISNPPWEDGSIEAPLDHAFYDPRFELMDTLLDGLPSHLTSGGRCLLAYGHRPALERLKEQCESRGFGFEVLDDREIEDLERDFLPGMLVEIKVPFSRLGQAPDLKVSENAEEKDALSGGKAAELDE